MLYSSIDDIVNNLTWQQQDKIHQPTLFDFTPDEKSIYDLIVENNEIHIDKISANSQITPNRLAEVLMKLELDGAIHLKAGNIYMA